MHSNDNAEISCPCPFRVPLSSKVVHHHNLVPQSYKLWFAPAPYSSHAARPCASFFCGSAPLQHALTSMAMRRTEMPRRGADARPARHA